MKIIQISTDNDLAERLDQCARRLGVTGSGFARDALRDALRRHEEGDREERHRAGYRETLPQSDEIDIPEEDWVWGDEARGLETTGGCLCGSVRYRVAEPLRPIIYCHCRQCRRTSGHFVAATAVARDALYIQADENLEWFASSDSASRGFCSRCGSSLFWLPKARDHVSIMAGTLDKPTGLKPVEHIYVKDKGDYYDLTDDLPKAPGHVRK